MSFSLLVLGFMFCFFLLFFSPVSNSAIFFTLFIFQERDGSFLISFIFYFLCVFHVTSPPPAHSPTSFLAAQSSFIMTVIIMIIVIIICLVARAFFQPPFSWCSFIWSFNDSIKRNK